MNACLSARDETSWITFAGIAKLRRTHRPTAFEQASLVDARIRLIAQSAPALSPYSPLPIVTNVELTVPVLGQLVDDHELASANLRRQHGHCPSKPRASVLNAVGCGRLRIALNANGARWA